MNNETIPASSVLREPVMSDGGSVNGRVAIVTGGSRGIGGAITQLLVDEGARIDDHIIEQARIVGTYSS